MSTTKTRTDIYTRVTDSIIEQLSHGVRPWLKPWNCEHAAGRITRPLRHNGTPYKGINILMLWASAEEAGFVSPFWLTFQQAKELGGHVKKGEHGSPVVYAATFKKKDQTDDGQETEEEIPFLKEYTVSASISCVRRENFSMTDGAIPAISQPVLVRSTAMPRALSFSAKRTWNLPSKYGASRLRAPN